MSALGQKQTCAAHKLMSALGHKRTSLCPKAAESRDEPDRGRRSDEIGGSKARWSNWHGNDDACRSKDGQCYGNEHELPNLNPQIECEERKGDIRMRQPGLLERAGKTKAVKKTEREATIQG